jgi:hypothetical protein
MRQQKMEDSGQHGIKDSPNLICFWDLSFHGVDVDRGFLRTNAR